MPGRSFPTSDSSTFPLKIMSSMSATVAIVVPALKVLVSMTEWPTSTGTSSTMPEMVERTSVFEALPELLAIPSWMSWRLSRAAASSASAVR